jgi:DDE family transposase
MTQHLTGALYADKGYIGRELFSKLWQRGLHLITSIRRNMGFLCSKVRKATWPCPEKRGNAPFTRVFVPPF